MQTRLIQDSRLHVSFAGNREKLFPTHNTHKNTYKNNTFYISFFSWKKYILRKEPFFSDLAKINFRAVDEFHTGPFPTNVFGLVSRSWWTFALN